MARVVPLWVVVAFLASVACASLDAQIEKRHYRETNGSRVSAVEYTVNRAGGQINLRSTGGTTDDEIQWAPGTGTILWKETNGRVGTDLTGERKGDMIHVTGRLRGKEIDKEIHVDGAPWYQIFGPIVNDLLPADVQQREFWVVNPDDLAPHKMLVRRAGAELLAFRGSRIETNKIHFSPAGMLAGFWGADFWYRQQDGEWIYSRLPEDGGMTINELQEPGR